MGSRRHLRKRWTRVLFGTGVAAGVLGALWQLAPSLLSPVQEARVALSENAGSSLSEVLGTPESENVGFVPVLFDDSIKEERAPVAPPYNGPWNDTVVYLGMNGGPTQSATRSLARRMPRGVSVITIADAPLADRVGRFDLRDYKGRRAFADSLGLPSQNARGVADSLDDAEPDARDELAQLAQIWARGQKGQIIPSRLVLAGHSNGDGVWGDNNGSLRLGALLTLARALPKAVVQIEDAFVTGCYSGGEVTMDQYLLIFPRAKTIWAYESQAPGVDNGGTIDQAGWEKATRGRSATFVPANYVIGSKKMAVWTAESGYHAPRPPLTLDQLRGKVQWMEETFFAPALEGKSHTFDGGYRIPLGITDPHTGLVRQYYSWLVRLTQQRTLPPDERAFWDSKKHQTIRLLYYSETVAPRFVVQHKSVLEKAYRQVGLDLPDYSELPRAQALREIKKFSQRVQKMKNPPSEATRVASLLERGLAELDPAVIPDGWV